MVLFNSDSLFIVAIQLGRKPGRTPKYLTITADYKAHALPKTEENGKKPDPSDDEKKATAERYASLLYSKLACYVLIFVMTGDIAVATTSAMPRIPWHRSAV